MFLVGKSDEIHWHTIRSALGTVILWFNTYFLRFCLQVLCARYTYHARYTPILSYRMAVSEVGQPLMVCRQEMSQLSKRSDGHK